MHEFEFEMKDEHDVVVLSKLRVNLQWIHSEVNN